mmetsp:Transcript_35562/g.53485  ORF Transcript_35562/g.53485 Transcript_35562/m.53485 type:complete len:250 (+) Transcript_35562:395-1144(+)
MHDGSVVELVEVSPDLVDGRLEGVDIHGLGELRSVHGESLVHGDGVGPDGVVGDDALVLVANDLQPMRIGGSNLLGNKRGGGERPSDLRALFEGDGEAVAEEPFEGGSSLRADAHVLGDVALALLLNDADSAELSHLGVDTTAKTLVGAHAEEGDGTGLVLAREALEELLHGGHKGLGHLHSPLVVLELGGGDHLHGLGDLLHVLEGPHSGLEGLQGGGIPGLLGDGSLSQGEGDRSDTPGEHGVSKRG